MNSTVKRLLFGSLFATLIIAACGARAQGPANDKTLQEHFGVEKPGIFGGGAPSAPVVVATPSPVAVATPTPAPTPEPTPEGEPPGGS